MPDRVLVGIPTKGRPEYLSGLLSTLMYQTEDEWDLMIVDTFYDPKNETPPVWENHQVLRLLGAIEALGHQVFRISQPTSIASEVSAVNRILSESVSMMYSFVFKVDDDHTLPPDALDSLLKDLRELERVHNALGRIVVSGVTPWMIKVWEDAAGPGDIIDYDGGLILDMWVKDGELCSSSRQFYRHRMPGLHSSKLVHPANFLMRSSALVLWSDIGSSSLYADALWSLALRREGYSFFVDTGVNAWHVAAPSGGVRLEDNIYIKRSLEDVLRKDLLVRTLQRYALDREGEL